VPIVAQIEGNCMGAGVEIASCCDIRMAGAVRALRRADCAPGFSDGAARGAAGGEALGELTAREMLLEAAVLDAPRCWLRGFLNRVLPMPTWPAEALARARRIAALAPQAARLNKQTLRALNQLNPSELGHRMLWKHSNQSAYAYADSAEHREGIAAFLGKRKPVF
jgi:enoyl-CoA hydratase